MRILPLIGLFITLSAHAKVNNNTTLEQMTNDPGADYSCSKIDLSEQMGPVRDQKDLSWCYAYAGADIITQYLHKTGNKVYFKGGTLSDKVSALQLVHEYQLANPGMSLVSSQDQGGQAGAALKALLQRGTICTEKDLSSNDGTQSPFLKELPIKVREYMMNLNPMAQEPTYPEAEKIVTEQILSKRCTTPIQDLIKVNHLRDTGRAADGPGYGTTQNKTYKRAIDEALLSGRIAGVSYFADFLQGGTNPRDYRHASSLVGRVFMNGSCHYILRNSWGPDCSTYVEPYKAQCHKGFIYVKESEFLERTYGVDTLSPMNSHDLEVLDNKTGPNTQISE